MIIPILLNAENKRPTLPRPNPSCQPTTASFSAHNSWWLNWPLSREHSHCELRSLKMKRNNGKPRQRHVVWAQTWNA